MLQSLACPITNIRGYRMTAVMNKWGMGNELLALSQRVLTHAIDGAQRERNRNHGKEFREYPQGVAKAGCFGKSTV